MFTPPTDQEENEPSSSNMRRPLLPCGAYYICARRSGEYGGGRVRRNTAEGNVVRSSEATRDSPDHATLPNLSEEGPPPFFTEDESPFSGRKLGRSYYLLMNKNATAYEDKCEELQSTHGRQHEHGHSRSEGWGNSVFGSSLFSTFGSYVGGGLTLAGGVAASALTNISRSAVLLSEDACTAFYVEDVLTARGVAKTCTIDTSPQHAREDITAGQQQARHMHGSPPPITLFTGDSTKTYICTYTRTVEGIPKTQHMAIDVRFDEANESVVGKEGDYEGEKEGMRSASQGFIMLGRREEGSSEEQASSDSERKRRCRTHKTSPRRYCFRIAHESAASMERRGGATFLCWDTNRFERSLNLGPWESFELHSIVETIPVTRQAALDALLSPIAPNVHYNGHKSLSIIPSSHTCSDHSPNNSSMPASGSYPPYFTFFIYSPSYDAYLRCDPNSYSWNKMSLVKKDALTHDDAWYFIPAT